MMTLSEARELGIIVADDNGTLKYNGLCKECKHSKNTAYPASSGTCMNKESEWYGCFHVDHNLMRYVNGCSVFEKKLD